MRNGAENLDTFAFDALKILQRRARNHEAAHTDLFAERDELFHANSVHNVVVDHDMQFQLRMAPADFPDAVHVGIITDALGEGIFHHLLDEVRLRKRILGGHIDLEGLCAVRNVAVHHFKRPLHRRAGDADIIDHRKTHSVSFQFFKS